MPLFNLNDPNDKIKNFIMHLIPAQQLEHFVQEIRNNPDARNQIRLMLQEIMPRLEYLIPIILSEDQKKRLKSFGRESIIIYGLYGVLIGGILSLCNIYLSLASLEKNPIYKVIAGIFSASLVILGFIAIFCVLSAICKDHKIVANKLSNRPKNWVVNLDKELLRVKFKVEKLGKKISALTESLPSIPKTVKKPFASAKTSIKNAIPKKIKRFFTNKNSLDAGISWLPRPCLRKKGFIAGPMLIACGLVTLASMPLASNLNKKIVIKLALFFLFFGILSIATGLLDQFFINKANHQALDEIKEQKKATSNEIISMVNMMFESFAQTGQNSQTAFDPPLD